MPTESVVFVFGQPLTTGVVGAVGDGVADAVWETQDSSRTEFRKAICHSWKTRSR